MNAWNRCVFSWIPVGLYAIEWSTGRRGLNWPWIIKWKGLEKPWNSLGLLAQEPCFSVHRSVDKHVYIYRACCTAPLFEYSLCLICILCCLILPSVLWRCWWGVRTGIRPVIPKMFSYRTMENCPENVEQCDHGACLSMSILLVQATDSTYDSNRRIRSMSNDELGYWHQRADERHGNPPPRLPGAISGQRQSWKTPRWAWGQQVHGMW